MRIGLWRDRGWNRCGRDELSERTITKINSKHVDLDFVLIDSWDCDIIKKWFYLRNFTII